MVKAVGTIDREGGGGIAVEKLANRLKELFNKILDNIEYGFGCCNDAVCIETPRF